MSELNQIIEIIRDQAQYFQQKLDDLDQLWQQRLEKERIERHSSDSLSPCQSQRKNKWTSQSVMNCDVQPSIRSVDDWRETYIVSTNPSKTSKFEEWMKNKRKLTDPTIKNYSNNVNKYLVDFRPFTPDEISETLNDRFKYRSFELWNFFFNTLH